MTKQEFYSILNKHGAKRLYCPVRRKMVKKKVCLDCGQPLNSCYSFKLLDRFTLFLCRSFWSYDLSEETAIKYIREQAVLFHRKMRELRRNNYTEEYLNQRIHSNTNQKKILTKL